MTEDIDDLVNKIFKLPPERPSTSKPVRRRPDGTQKPDPNSNTSRRKEQKRLEERTPAQIRRDEIIEERKRLKEKLSHVDTERVIRNIEKGSSYSDLRRKHAEVKKVQQKRKQRYGRDK